MLNIGPEKLVVILGIALIVLGPDKLPDTARKLGNLLTELRRLGDGLHPGRLLEKASSDGEVPSRAQTDSRHDQHVI